MNRMLVGAGLLWVLTISSIALWAPSPGGEIARADVRHEELMTHLEQVKRREAEIDEVLRRGGLQMDAAGPRQSRADAL